MANMILFSLKTSFELVTYYTANEVRLLQKIKIITFDSNDLFLRDEVLKDPFFIIFYIVRHT